MSESEEKPFTVNDRRKFTAEGRPREEAVGLPSSSSDPVPATADPLPGPDAPDAPDAGAGPRPPSGPVDFGGFLLSLGAQAGTLLSGAAEEEGIGAEDALAHAQSIISILEMLEDKTRGRRTAEEDRLLEELLFQLRMAYVQKRQAGTP